MFGYENIETKDGEGGYLIPRVAYIDKASSGRLAVALRWVGQRIICFGSWVKSFGYHQVEIHPYNEIIEAVREIEVEKVR